jgi:UDP-N-acetylmuramyl pentapeptide phosphotransferase/UDP-N-acetylglucosamine-1-phosphate transferase
MQRGGVRDASPLISGAMLIDWWSLAGSALCAGILMPVAIRARSFGHDDTDGVQKVHVEPTSRLGGAALALTFLAAVAIARALDFAALSAAWPLALTALPVVLVGLWEDVTRRVRPRYRLLAAVASGALASAYAGGIIPRLDLPGVDDLLTHLWFVLPLTWFMVAGACNAINLIDGTHGLAGGTALIMFGGLALAAAWSGDALTLAPALVVMGALIGFLFWNYPRGRIFLGDAGAYFLGFMYAELSIQLIARNGGISAWYVIMLAGYPIVETLFSMYRRGAVRGLPLMAPDALHLHSLVFRRITLPLERRMHDKRSGKHFNLRQANGRVAPRLWVHSAMCLALAVAFSNNTPALWLGLLAYAAFYVSRYRALVRFGRKSERRHLADRPGPNSSGSPKEMPPVNRAG